MKHPWTGLHYLHVVPEAAGFIEVRQRFEQLAATWPWMSVAGQKSLGDIRQSALWRDSRNFVVLWGSDEVDEPSKDRAGVAHVYTEAIGERTRMLPEHAAELDRVSRIASSWDGVLAHTPWMASAIGKATRRPSAVFPLGFGAYDFIERVREPKVSFYGCVAGRRRGLVPTLAALLDDRFVDVSGVFAQRLVDRLSQYQATIYLQHSDVTTGNVWRPWQAAAAGTVLIADVCDLWPLVPWTHYVPLSRDRDLVVPTVSNVLNDPLLASEISGRLRELANEFDTVTCVEKYLLPASTEIMDKRA